MLERKKRVLVGVTGGIAAYKACEIVSTLAKNGVDVKVIMTKSACEFVRPKSFEVLSKNPVITDMFGDVKEYEVEHISLAKWADVFVISPATANIIGKFAHGIADDMLTTTYMASKSKKIIVPAMNTNMYESCVFQENLEKLRNWGDVIVPPIVGNLACGDNGKGKMESPAEICKVIFENLEITSEMKGKKVIVTSGGTMEDIDKVRYITNYSSGKMGTEIAKCFENMGAEVIFIYGKMDFEPPHFYKNIKVKTTQDMYEKVMEELQDVHAIIKAAAPCDFKIKGENKNKIKEKEILLEFTANVDIAKAVGEKKGDKILVIFSAETENLIENAKGKLKRKNANFVVANDVTMEGAGFLVDTNIATLIFENGKEEKLEKMKKSSLAKIICKRTSELLESSYKK